MLALGAGLPARADSQEDRYPGYFPVLLEQDGHADRTSLDRLQASLRREVQAGRSDIVLLIHGFGVEKDDGVAGYREIARRFNRQGSLTGSRPLVVGIHWASYSGPTSKWLLNALGYRVTSLLGFKKAVKNPYLDKVKLARRTGRTGLRSVLFRLQDSFPQARMHVMAHSLGAELAVAALAPESLTEELVGKDAAPVEQPDRPPRVSMVTLAGADLDRDAFSRDERSLRAALPHAQVWWVTVPEKNQADGVLELRRGAGRGDALGNVGMSLVRSDLDNLLRRRALVVDQSDIPKKHRITEYFCDARIRSLCASMAYLGDPASPAGKESILARLDGVLKADQAGLTVAAEGKDPCARLYASWRRDPATRQYGAVAVVEAKVTEKVAGSRQETP